MGEAPNGGPIGHYGSDAGASGSCHWKGASPPGCREFEPFWRSAKGSVAWRAVLGGGFGTFLEFIRLPLDVTVHLGAQGCEM